MVDIEQVPLTFARPATKRALALMARGGFTPPGIVKWYSKLPVKELLLRRSAAGKPMVGIVRYVAIKRRQGYTADQIAIALDALDAESIVFQKTIAACGINAPHCGAMAGKSK